MVDELEDNNPGRFDNPDNTFADLYMEAGLYITEIVKRLFRSEKMKEECAHFVEADAASKEGRLPEMVEECFG